MIIIIWFRRRFTIATSSHIPTTLDFHFNMYRAYHIFMLLFNAVFLERWLYCIVAVTYPEFYFMGAASDEARRAEVWCPAGPKVEAEGRGGEGVLGEGRLASSHQLGGLGERCKLPRRGLEQSPRSQTFLFNFDCLWWHLNLVATRVGLL